MTHTVETLGFDRETMFPNYHADVMAGRAVFVRGAEHAQDRVAMRRYLRSVMPDVDPVVFRDMNAEALSVMVDQAKGVYG